MAKVKIYEKLPVKVEAIKFEGECDIPEFDLNMFDSDDDGSCNICGICGNPARKHGNVKTLEGFHIACPGDYIIRGIHGEHYPCKPDIFKKTYREV